MISGQVPPPNTEAPAYPGPPVGPSLPGPAYPGPPVGPSQPGPAYPGPLVGPFQPGPAYPGPHINTLSEVVQSQPVNFPFVLVNKPTDVPGHMECPYCQTSVLTEIKYKNGERSWMLCFTLAIAMCFLFSWIPLCVKSCKDVHHYCPNCHKVIHIHKQ